MTVLSKKCFPRNSKQKAVFRKLNAVFLNKRLLVIAHECLMLLMAVGSFKYHPGLSASSLGFQSLAL